MGKTTNQGQDFYRTRRDGVPARVTTIPCGEAIHFDGFSSSHGLSISTQVGTENKRKWERIKMHLAKQFVRNHPLTIPYWSVTIFIGLAWQGWIPGM